MNCVEVSVTSCRHYVGSLNGVGRLPEGFVGRLHDRWQIEGTQGWLNDDWSAELNEISVGPGKVIQTWTGLQESVDQREVRRRHEIKKLGTLIIPIIVDRRRVEERIRL